MKYLQLFENFESEKSPKSITVEMTDLFIQEKGLYKINNIVKMRPDILYNLGNTTPQTADNDILIYFAAYRPEIGELSVFCFEVPPFKKGETEWFLYLTKHDQLWPAEIDRIFTYVQNGELKLSRSTNCIFRKDDYYGTEGLVPGAIDHRGYFKIVDITE